MSCGPASRWHPFGQTSSLCHRCNHYSLFLSVPPWGRSLQWHIGLRAPHGDGFIIRCDKLIVVHKTKFTCHYCSLADEASYVGDSISCSPSDLSAPEAPAGVQKSSSESNSSCRDGPPMRPSRAGGGGSGTQKFVYQNWPDQIVPLVDFVFSHDGRFGLGGGGVQGQQAGPHMPLLVCMCSTVLRFFASTSDPMYKRD